MRLYFDAGTVECRFFRKKVISVLIRSVEFQDSFTRIPVQGARQQSLDLSRPDMQQRQMAQVAVEQAVQDQGRPTASEQTDEGGIDPNSRPLPERPRRERRRRRQEAPEAEEHLPPHVGATGTHVDFVA
jgi:hypothetical protein